MEDAQRQGKIRSLGVSNFNVPDLKTLRKIAKLPISVVQNWFDPIHQDTVVRKFCKQQNIRYMGYSTLGELLIINASVLFNEILNSLTACTSSDNLR